MTEILTMRKPISSKSQRPPFSFRIRNEGPKQHLFATVLQTVLSLSRNSTAYAHLLEDIPKHRFHRFSFTIKVHTTQGIGDVTYLSRPITHRKD